VAITSEPAGATVTADGKELGVTPLALAELPPGPVKFALAAKGYDTGSVGATIEPGVEAALHGDLKKTAAPAPKRSTASSTKSRSTGSKSSSSKPNEPSTGQKILEGFRTFGVPGRRRPF
jgi:hypothetical protein